MISRFDERLAVRTAAAAVSAARLAAARLRMNERAAASFAAAEARKRLHAIAEAAAKEAGVDEAEKVLEDAAAALGADLIDGYNIEDFSEIYHSSCCLTGLPILYGDACYGGKDEGFVILAAAVTLAPWAADLVGEPKVFTREPDEEESDEIPA